MSLTEGVDRRRFLQVGAAAGLAGAAVVLDPVAFSGTAAASTPPRPDETRVVTGRLEVGAPDWVYLPVDVPRGVRELSVRYSYDRPTPPGGQAGNALDIGVFDSSGYALGDAHGFRGWSGGARDSFTISRTAATPGYLPGPIEPGRWHVVLGPYTVAPQGLAYRVEVTLRYGDAGPAFMPNPAPERAAGRGRDWYRGDLHLHTVHSDGRYTPAELAAGARAAGLDFMVSTDHNTSSASAVWGAYAGDDLLIVDGEEITTRNGHWLAVGLPTGAWIDWRYRATDGSFAEFAGQVHRLGGQVIGAHPYCPFVGCAWKFGYGRLDAVEVWNGPWTADDEVSVATWDGMLVEDGRSGRWLPAVGNSDAHRARPGRRAAADGRTGPRAGHPLGPGRRPGRAQLDRRVRRRAAVVPLHRVGPDGRDRRAAAGRRWHRGRRRGDRLGRARLRGPPVTDEGQVLLAPVDATGVATVEWVTRPQVSVYVRIEVRRPDPAAGPLGAMVAMTNPVFLGRARG